MASIGGPSVGDVDHLHPPVGDPPKALTDHGLGQTEPTVPLPGADRLQRGDPVRGIDREPREGRHRPVGSLSDQVQRRVIGRRPKERAVALDRGGVTEHGVRRLHPAGVGASLDWAWRFTFDRSDDGRTRRLVRNRSRVNPRWLDLAYLATMVPADHVMTREMLPGLQQGVAQ